MNNPWLGIPADDYEGHMNLPHVAQYPFLASLFGEFIRQISPASVALLGCATGNGLEHIDSSITRRVTAVDINPEYCSICRNRHETTLTNLEIICDDISNVNLDPEEYSLIYGALFFEYLDPAGILPMIGRAIDFGGYFVAVLQLPSKAVSAISPSPYSSISTLSSIMNLVDPDRFDTLVRAAGLNKTEGTVLQLPYGKSFYRGVYRKPESGWIDDCNVRGSNGIS